MGYWRYWVEFSGFSLGGDAGPHLNGPPDFQTSYIEQSLNPVAVESLALKAQGVAWSLKELAFLKIGAALLNAELLAAPAVTRCCCTRKSIQW